LGIDKEKARQALDKVFGDLAGAMAAGMAFVGVRTGLFRAMQGKGAMQPEDVARASSLQPRYVEEWLKGMASAGYLEYDPRAGTFTLPEEQAYFLASDETDHFVGGLLAMVPPAAAHRPRGGRGVPPRRRRRVRGIRPRLRRRARSRQPRPVRAASRALAAGGSGGAKPRRRRRALDVGCGSGSVCGALAKAFPAAEIVGIDPDPESIRRAQQSFPAVKFLQETTSGMNGGGGFDLITLCDVLHDLAAPLATLREIRALLKPDVVLFVVEPKAADRLEDNRNPVATTFYSFSLFHCMTQSLARSGRPGDVHGTGSDRESWCARRASAAAIRSTSKA
jgi:2-polyprenyl-3-methyl-5-hydroxy-6-metoxy-1,4-benzoquinol methylase